MLKINKINLSLREYTQHTSIHFKGFEIGSNIQGKLLKSGRRPLQAKESLGKQETELCYNHSAWSVLKKLNSISSLFYHPGVFGLAGVFAGIK